MPPSSSQSSLTSPSPQTSTTPRASSPLNPSTATPTKVPLTLSPVEDDDDDEPFAHFSFGAPRGHSHSSLRSLPAPSASASNSHPSPNPTVKPPLNDAPLSSLSLPETLDAMTLNAMPSTFRDRSRSRSPNRDALALAQPSFPSSHLASSWWGSSEHTSRPWKDSPKRKKSVPPEQTASWDRTRMVRSDHRSICEPADDSSTSTHLL
jgi:abelson tyrosine-protein kinase 1